MSKKFVFWAAVISCILGLAMAGGVQAATSSIDNLPGGAGISYWQAGSSWITLANLQNIRTGVTMTVSVSIYDRDSNLLCGFSLPFIGDDNVGFSLTGDGSSTITITPYSDTAFGGSGIPSGGLPCTAPGVNGLQFGYLTYVIDNFQEGINPKGISNTRRNYITPDFLLMRAAMIRGSDAAFAINAASIQGFSNMMKIGDGTDPVGLTEFRFIGKDSPNNTSQFVNTNGADAICTVIVDWNGAAGTDFNSIDNTVGPNIDSWELYLTDNYTQTFSAPDWRPRLVVDGSSSGGSACSSAGRKRALGSADGNYWGRFNATPGLTSTMFILVFPANSQSGTADRRSTNGGVAFIAYDDAAHFESSITATHDVTRASFNNISDPDYVPHLSNAGEVRMNTSAPMFGFAYTETSGFADVYAFVRQNIWVMSTNLTDGNFFFADPVANATNAIRIP